MPDIADILVDGQDVSMPALRQWLADVAAVIASGRFANVAAVAAYQVPAPIMLIRTIDYAAAGDGGGAQYKRVAAEPSHPGKVQDAAGAWWEIAPIDGIGKVESFGAKPSGLIADAAANVTALRNAHLALKANAFKELHYRIGGQYHVGAFTGAVQQSLLGAAELSGISGTINGNGAAIVFSTDKQTTHDIYLADRFNGLRISNLNFIDTAGPDTAASNPKGMRAITALGGFAENAAGLEVDGCTFTGVLGCVTVLTNDANAAGRVRSIEVTGCTGFDVYYGFNAQNDGDGVKVDLVLFNVRRALFVYGVSNVRYNLRVSHDGVYGGSDGMVKIVRTTRNTFDIQGLLELSGAVEDFQPVSIEHQNDDAGASIIDGVDATVSYGALGGGNATPACKITNRSADGTEQLTKLNPAGDTGSPVTTFQKTFNVKLRITASAWGAEPFVSAAAVPFDPGNVVLDVPPGQDARAVRLEGYLVNGWFEFARAGTAHNQFYSVPLRHVRNSKLAIEIETTAFQNTDGSGSGTIIYRKRHIAHGRIQIDGGTAQVEALRELEDQSTTAGGPGAPDLALTNTWGWPDRYVLGTATGHFSGADSLVRLRARPYSPLMAVG